MGFWSSARRAVCLLRERVRGSPADGGVLRVSLGRGGWWLLLAAQRRNCSFIRRRDLEAVFVTTAYCFVKN